MVQQMAHHCPEIDSALVRSIRQRYLRYELVEGIRHCQKSYLQGDRYASVLGVIKSHVRRGAEALVIHPSLQSGFNKRRPKVRTGPVITAPLPVDQVPGRREGLVT